MAKGAHPNDQEWIEHFRRLEPFNKQRKKERHSWMQVQPGQRILDIGCGIGIDTVLLADQVGPTGSVVGIDISDEMIQQADERARDAGVLDIVEHIRGDVLALPYDDNEFDACLAERVFTHLDDPIAALNEAVRVTKSGGYILISNSHYATFDIDTEYIDLAWRIRRAKTDNHVSGYLANRLPRYMREAGLHIEKIDNSAYYTTSFEIAYQSILPHIVENTVAAGVATETEMKAFMAEQQRFADEGHLFVSGNGISIVGRKPE